MPLNCCTNRPACSKLAGHTFSPRRHAQPRAVRFANGVGPSAAIANPSQFIVVIEPAFSQRVRIFVCQLAALCTSAGENAQTMVWAAQPKACECRRRQNSTRFQLTRPGTADLEILVPSTCVGIDRSECSGCCVQPWSPMHMSAPASHVKPHQRSMPCRAPAG